MAKELTCSCGVNKATVLIICCIIMAIAGIIEILSILNGKVFTLIVGIYTVCLAAVGLFGAIKLNYFWLFIFMWGCGIGIILEIIVLAVEFTSSSPSYWGIVGAIVMIVVVVAALYCDIAIRGGFMARASI